MEIFKRGEFRALPVEVSVVDEFSTLRSGMYLVAPQGDELKPGATYRFTVDRADRRGRGHKQVVVTIDQETLSATATFGLDVGPTTNEVIELAAAVTCSDGLNVTQVRISGNLAHSARRWREQLLYRTIVGEEIHWRPRASLCQIIAPGRSWESVGQDRIFASCAGRSHEPFIPLVLKPRRHTLMIQAVLPGTGIVLKTPVKTVDLGCLDPASSW